MPKHLKLSDLRPIGRRKNNNLSIIMNETNAITVKYGLSGSITLDFDYGTTVSQVLADSRVRNALGLPENFVVLSHGEEVDSAFRLTVPTTLRVEKQACTKGA